MADPQNEFASLMARVRAGDRQALQDLCNQYGGHVRRVIRRKLDDRLRPKYDSIDFTQDVWASFVAVPPERYTFETPDQLILYLSRVASNKVIDAWREHLGTGKRDLNRQLELETGAQEPIATRQPTPSQIAVADERWELILTGLTPRQRQIIELVRGGHSYQEIAEQLHLHPKAVQRLVNKLSEQHEP